MGRIKTQLIKRKTNQLYRECKEEAKPDFEANKKLVSRKIDVDSKKLRNIIAGYLTRIVKREE